MNVKEFIRYIGLERDYFVKWEKKLGIVKVVEKEGERNVLIKIY